MTPPASRPKPGRPETDRVRVQHVEALLCAGVPGRKHQLTNRTEGNRLVTYCQFCEAEWSSLDAAARADVRAVEFHRKGRRP